MSSSQKHTTVHLLETRLVTADERVARKLAIAVGQRAIYIRLCSSYSAAAANRSSSAAIFASKRRS